jgi:hypothetical protein
MLKSILSRPPRFMGNKLVGHLTSSSKTRKSLRLSSSLSTISNTFMSTSTTTSASTSTTTTTSASIRSHNQNTNHHLPQIRYASTPTAAYNQRVDTFPSIVIGSDGLISAQGPFAEAQAQVNKFIHSYIHSICCYYWYCYWYCYWSIYELLLSIIIIMGIIITLIQLFSLLISSFSFFSC